MVFIAVDTTVWSSAARNIPSSSPESTTMICRCVRAPDPAGPASTGSWAGTVAAVMRRLQVLGWSSGEQAGEDVVDDARRQVGR